MAGDAVSEALRESDERYRTLFAQAPFGVFLYDRTLRLTDCNPYLVELLQSTYQRLIGFDLRMLQDVAVLPAIEQVFDGSTGSYVGPYRATTSSVVIHISARTSPLRDEDGEVVGGMAIVEDIGDAVRILEQLRLSQRRLSGLVEQSPLAVIGWTPEGKVREWNQAATRLFGYSADEALGHLPKIFASDRSRPQVIEAMRCWIAGSRGERRLYENVTKDGRLLLCEWHSSALIDDDGKVIGLSSFVQDVTEQHLAAEALRRSEQRFRDLIERSPEALVVIRDGVVAYANPAMLVLLGYDDLAAVLSTAPEAFVHEEERERFRQRVRQQLDQGLRLGPEEYRLVRHDQRSLPIEFLSVTLEYDGQPAVIGIVRDVSERKLLQLRLLQADRLVSVGTLAAGVAHEINNPLAYVLANLEHVLEKRLPALQSGLASSDRADLREHLMRTREMLEIAREGARDVATIVRDLRTFARPDEGSSGPVDVHRVLDASIDLARHEIKLRCELVRSYGSGVPFVRGNAARLGQVFLNLLMNASQAITAAGPRADGAHRIVVQTARGSHDRVVITVSDTGIGIPPEIRSRIFDPFFTTKPVGVGTGLGLWIAQNVVASLGGTIHVESAPGSTHLAVTLPVHEADLCSAVEDTIHAEPLEGPSHPPTRPPSAKSVCATSRPRVLIIDDEPSVARALRNGLGEGVDVTFVTSGREALELLEGRETAAYDLILCDLMMPDIDGIELHRILAERRPELLSRIVFATGGAYTQEAHRFLDTDGIRHLEKPFDIRDVCRLIRPDTVAPQS